MARQTEIKFLVPAWRALTRPSKLARTPEPTGHQVDKLTHWIQTCSRDTDILAMLDGAEPWARRLTAYHAPGDLLSEAVLADLLTDADSTLVLAARPDLPEHGHATLEQRATAWLATGWAVAPSAASRTLLQYFSNLRNLGPTPDPLTDEGLVTLRQGTELLRAIASCPPAEQRSVTGAAALVLYVRQDRALSLTSERLVLDLLRARRPAFQLQTATSALLQTGDQLARLGAFRVLMAIPNLTGDVLVETLLEIQDAPDMIAALEANTHAVPTLWRALVGGVATAPAWTQNPARVRSATPTPQATTSLGALLDLARRAPAPTLTDVMQAMLTWEPATAVTMLEANEYDVRRAVSQLELLPLVQRGNVRLHERALHVISDMSGGHTPLRDLVLQ